MRSPSETGSAPPPIPLFLSAPPVQERAQEDSRAEGGQRGGQRLLFDLPTNALSVTLGFAPDLFGRGLDRFTRFGDTVGDALARGPGNLCKVGAEPFDVGLQRGDIGVRLVSHNCPPLW